MSLYDSVRDLPLVVAGYALDGLEQQVSSGFLRKSTVIRLHGAGEEGCGEDVTYEATEHDRVQAQGPVAPAGRRRGRSTAFSQHLATLPLFDHEPEQHAYLDYRRWGYESAALDLALRQAGTVARARSSDRPVEPLTFVVSMRLGAARDDRPPAGLARALPDAPLQARRDGRLVERADRRARARPARSTRSTSRASTAARRSTPSRIRRSTGASSTGCRAPGSRIRR